VDAHLDWAALDPFWGPPDLDYRESEGDPNFRPSGANRVFSFPLSLDDEPRQGYANAAVVQLFYWCNWMHDRLYDLGFTETAGNFQFDNFGLGGDGGDPVLADAQDAARVNNASMTTPYPDGSSPRMEMHLYNGPTPDRDSDLDAEVVLHEYTHGLTTRRVAKGVLGGLSDVQSWGMDEGWSDFMALAMLSEPTDGLSGNWATGGYVNHKRAGLEENYYYGDRRYPYSTNLNRNPLTFKDIDPRQADSHSGVPRSPIVGVPGGISEKAHEVHNIGEVWCVMLWEVRAALIGFLATFSG
jgi:hypothetical protein